MALAESVAISTRVEQILLRTFPEVSEIVTKLGRPDLATEAMGIYQGDVYVLLHPEDDWASGRTKDELIDAMAGTLSHVPGVAVNFTQPMAMRLDEVVSGIKADVAVKVFGPTPRVLERLGAQVLAVVETSTAPPTPRSRWCRAPPRSRSASTGRAWPATASAWPTCGRWSRPPSAAAQVTELLDGARRFPVVVRLPAAMRQSPEALGSLVVTAAGGERVPLGQLADVRIAATPEAVNHENAQRRMVVQTNVRGRDLGSFVAEAQRRLAGAVALPAGYYLAWGGQFENQQRATARLAVVVPLSLAIIFLLLFATFHSVRWALLILVNVPFAAVGGIAALWLRGLTLNLSASVGFIALFGVAVLNGVVMIAAIRALRDDEGLELREATLRGAASRLRPVLMTALVAAHRLPADGAVARRRRRGAAAAGHGGHRRRRDVDAADPDRAADAVRHDGGVGGAPGAPAGLTLCACSSSRTIPRSAASSSAAWPRSATWWIWSRTACRRWRWRPPRSTTPSCST